MKKFFTLIAMMFVAGATFAQDDVEWGPNEFENSDLEADVEYPWFHVKSNFENPDGAITTAVPVAGVGVDGSKGIKVVAKAGAKQAWDSQFWIQIPNDVLSDEKGVLEFGEQVLISFDCRADWETIAGEEVDEVNIGTQGHDAPSNYRNNTGVGTVSFKKEWTRHTATMAPDANPYSIAFNLCEGHFEDDVTFYIDNITIQRIKKSEEIVQYWDRLNGNNNLERDGFDSYVVRIYQQGDSDIETLIAEGEGVDDSRCLKIVVPAKVENDWDSQFFIKLNEGLPSGTSFRVRMDIKASEAPANNPETQSHTTPGNYIYYQCIGTPTFTTDWTTYQRTVNVSTDMSTSEKTFQTIAFNLARNDHEITYYFDNIYIEILKEGGPGDIPEILALQRTIDNVEDAYLSSDKPANAEVREAFRAAYDNAQNIVAALDQENAEDAMYELINAESKFTSSTKDYQNLLNYIDWAKAKMDEANAMGENYEGLASIIDDITGGLDDAVSAEEWTKEEINANTNKEDLRKKIAAYIAENVKDGDDITIMIENPSFAGNTSGWNRDGGSKGLDYGPSNRNILDMEDGKDGFLPTGMAEVWHGTYNAYQDLPTMPAGLYTLTVNACQRGDDGSNLSGVLYAVVAGQESNQLIMSVYDDPADHMLFDTDGIMANGQENSGMWPSIENPNGDGWIPNGKGSANYHLNAGYYLNTVNVLMNEAGDLRVGIKDEVNSTNWVVMDNFRIVYHSLDNKLAYAAAVENQIKRLDALRKTDGIELTGPAEDAIQNGISAGEALLASDYTLEACVEMNEKLGAAFDDAMANANAMKAMQTAIDNFYNGYGEFCDDEETYCTPAIKKEADDVDAAYNAEDYMDYTTEGVKEFTNKINYLIDAMKVPAEVADASDENPVELDIHALSGADVDFEDYAEVGANANYPGWNGNGFGTGGGTAGPVGERWNQSNGFNTHTTIKGLPEGRYMLTVDGAYRTSLSNDWKIVNGDATTDNEAFFYATTSKETAQVALHNIATGGLTAEQCDDLGLPTSADVSTYTNTVVVDSVMNEETGKMEALTESTVYYFPDQLYTADLWMQSGKYAANTIVVDVPADGTLRIGVKRKGQSNDWCFVDNFKLFYLGTDSKAEPTALDIIKTNNAVKAIYTISGVRVNNMNKAGLYIVNGKKVLVK